MSDQYEKTKKWYRLLKENARCIVCEHENGQAETHAEFHHIDAKRKKDCVNRFVGRNQPTAALLEVLKCAPLCRTHHSDLHKHPDDPRYNLEQPQYKVALDAFHHTAIMLAPDEAFAYGHSPARPEKRRDHGRQLRIFG